MHTLAPTLFYDTGRVFVQTLVQLALKSITDSVATSFNKQKPGVREKGGWGSNWAEIELNILQIEPKKGHCMWKPLVLSKSK